MKRLLLVASLGLATAFAPVSYAAGPPDVGNPGGTCDGDVDVVCRPYQCAPDLPCTIVICGVWLDGECFRR